MINPSKIDFGRRVFVLRAGEWCHGYLHKWYAGRTENGEPLCVISFIGGDLVLTVLNKHCYWPEDYKKMVNDDYDFYNQKPETKGMNYSIAALLLNPDKCRAIMTTYDVDPTDDTKPRVKRELKKSFDPNIKAGDLVIVPTNTRHKFTVVKVVAVDVDWEPDTSEQVDWIVGVVNTDGYLDLQKQEAEMIGLAKESEKTAKRNDLKDKMFKHVNQDQINSLQITSAGPKTIEGSGS